MCKFRVSITTTILNNCTFLVNGSVSFLMLNEMANLSSSFDTGDVVLLMVVCVWVGVVLSCSV